jgi:uncharacterized protein YbjT (DUF2867 family)
MSTVLVTGATGHLGGRLLPRLIADGHVVRTFSRTTTHTPAPMGIQAFTGDLTDGTGLREAIEGIDVVVHCATDPRHPESDVTSTDNLIRALNDSGQDVHLVYISIVGVDALPWSYYRAKYEAERAIETAELSWTIQRATQFHSFVDTMLGQLARSPLMVVPRGFSFQPVATVEVADRLVEHVDRGPAGRAADFGGPEILSAKDLARSWLKANRKHHPVLAVPLPGTLSRAFRSGANVCADGTRGHFTWQDYLATTNPEIEPVTPTVTGARP